MCRNRLLDGRADVRDLFLDLILTGFKLTYIKYIVDKSKKIILVVSENLEIFLYKKESSLFATFF